MERAVQRPRVAEFLAGITAAVVGLITGADPFIDHHHIDGRFVTEYAESLGLGSRSYDMR